MTKEENEHPLFEVIKNSKPETIIEDVRNFFEIDGVSIEILDGSGMTPLMHACWKGNVSFAKFLIDQGADVNGGDHEHQYTALHFAALAGKPKVCELLMQEGCKIDAVNSVKRTASQMGAFVGNHDCVAVINNYVPKESVYYYTKKQPFEENAKLPLAMAQPLHKLVMTMNSHPVKIAIFLKNNPDLYDNLPILVKILELMSEKEFKNRRDVNEVLSLKYHMLYFIVKDIQKEKVKDEKSEKESSKTPFIDRWIKSMLVGRELDGFPVFQENFLRQGVKEFPFPESQLFKTLVTNFHHCKNYGEGMTAAEYINQAFNGQRGFQDGDNCACCGDEKAKKCSACKVVCYCSQVCQKYHRFVHKKFCQKLKEKMESSQKTQSNQENASKDSKEKEKIPEKDKEEIGRMIKEQLTGEVDLEDKRKDRKNEKWLNGDE